MEFDDLLKDLVKMNGEAKDNDKFLNTLERQFNILDSRDLNTIVQCLPSLFNGLRLVFIISRHYKDQTQMSQLLITICNQLRDRVAKAVKLQSILIPQPGVNYEEQLKEAIEKIRLAKDVLESWVKHYR